MREEQILATARAAFLEEARDLLSQLEASLLSLAEAPDPESVNAAFRAAHTIKGSAGLFGFEAVVTFTHDVEALLELLRSHQVPVTDATVTLLLECRDQIERLMDAVEGTEASVDLQAESSRLITLLRRTAQQAAGAGASAAEGAAALEVPATPPVAAHGSAEEAKWFNADHDDWVLLIRFGHETFTMGFDPLSFLRFLPTVGEVVAAECLFDVIQPLDEADPERCQLGMVVRLNTAADKRAIEAVFDFVAESIQLRILPPTRKLEEMQDLLRKFADEEARLGELLVRVGALTQKELDFALARQQADATAVFDPASNATAPKPMKLGEAIIESGLVAPTVVQAAVERQGQIREKKAEESRFVRVQADKLDALISLIGELVIAGSATQILATRLKDEDLLGAATKVCSLVEGARDRALQLRMVQIGETFSRFKRIAHEVSRSLGKDVDLTITGGDTELDKSMVDQIVDPLTHLVRNALDHGLETPAERTANGKSPRGQLALHAYHESGSIVIKVTDDGRGLNRERILAKAIQRGLVSAGADISDAQVYDLIFLPGFSTADQVTDLSGRGVGMDVVRRNIQSLRGEVSLSSTPGQGSAVQIRLPLTLAIIDGFRVEVTGQAFVVPLDSVVECIETPSSLCDSPQDLESGDACFHLRGEVLPLLCLRTHLALGGEPPALRSVLVMRAGNRKVGLLVDRLLGEHQTVIKPLGPLFRKLRGISGSTILGTGSVALILDIPALAQRAGLLSQRTRTAPPAISGPGTTNAPALPAPSQPVPPRRSTPAALAA